MGIKSTFWKEPPKTFCDFEVDGVIYKNISRYYTEY